YPIKLERGRKIREINSHVKICVTIGLIGSRKRVVLGVEEGKAYSSEVNLLKSLLKKMEFRGFYFIGDKGYDSIEIIRDVKERRQRSIHVGINFICHIFSMLIFTLI
ncbi:MAG: transposase, partial [Caldanaerobacter sp.]